MITLAQAPPSETRKGNNCDHFGTCCVSVIDLIAEAWFCHLTRASLKSLLVVFEQSQPSTVIVQG